MPREERLLKESKASLKKAAENYPKLDIFVKRQKVIDSATANSKSNTSCNSSVQDTESDSVTCSGILPVITSKTSKEILQNDSSIAMLCETEIALKVGPGKTTAIAETQPDKSNVDCEKKEKRYKGFRLKKDSILASFSWIVVNRPNINGVLYGYCSTCSENLNQAVAVSKNRTLPIATMPGICLKNYERFVDHNFSTSHRLSEEAMNLKRAWNEPNKMHPWVQCLQKTQIEVCRTLINLTLTVYNDLRIGTLSPRSWPSRHLTNIHAMHQINRLQSAALKDAAPFLSFEPTGKELQNVSPVKYCEVANIIGEFEMEKLSSKIDSCTSIGIQIDGSQDRMACDVKFITLRLWNLNQLESVFLGMYEPEQRGAKGLMEALQNRFNSVGRPIETLKEKLTSITTDGEAANTGKHAGLWTQLMDFLNKKIITIWCSCHRSDLAFERIEAEVPEVNLWKADLLSITSYFRGAKSRWKTLRQLASKLDDASESGTDSDCSEVITKGVPSTSFFDCPLRRFPKYFEVRIAEHFYRLVTSFLGNLKICKQYFETTDTSKLLAKEKAQLLGYQHKCKNSYFIHMSALMVDVLQIFQHLQKILQKDNLIITELRVAKNTAIIKFQNMLHNTYPGGAEEEFCSQHNIQQNNQQFPTHINGRQITNKYVSFRRPFGEVRCEIINSAIAHLEEQLKDDEITTELDRILLPKTASELLASCEPFIEKYLLCSKSKIYDECCHLESSNKLPLDASLSAISSEPEIYPEFNKIYYAIQCAAPHSMMVERCISSYNKVKTADRSSLSMSTLQNNLLVAINGVGTSHFDPMPVVCRYFEKIDRRNRLPNTKCYKSGRKFVQKFFKPSPLFNAHDSPSQSQ